MRTAQDILENMEELINGQKKEIASLKEQLKREQDCTDFYADKDTWIEYNSFMLIRDDDLCINDDNTWSGGERARATQARREK